jgi:hypothetical protein
MELCSVRQEARTPVTAVRGLSSSCTSAARRSLWQPRRTAAAPVHSSFFVCLSTCLSLSSQVFHLSVCLSICLSLRSRVFYLSVCLSVSAESIFLSVWLSVCLSVHLTVSVQSSFLSVCLTDSAQSSLPSTHGATRRWSRCGSRAKYRGSSTRTRRRPPAGWSPSSQR